MEVAAAKAEDETWARALTSDELEDWKVQVSEKLRAACRHLAQAVSRRNGWALRLLHIVHDDEEKPPKPSPPAAQRGTAEITPERTSQSPPPDPGSRMGNWL